MQVFSKRLVPTAVSKRWLRVQRNYVTSDAKLGPQNTSNESETSRALFDLDGKTAVVTGGTRGLGLAFAQALSAFGAKIAILDVGEQPAKFLEMGKTSGAQVSFHKTNVADPDEVKLAVQKIVSIHGSIDICVACAGVAMEEAFLDVAPHTLRKLLAVNTEGIFYTNQACARQMIEQKSGGSIINIGSIAGVKAMRSQKLTTAYTATKGAVIAYTRALAQELAPHRIRVNSISPGFMLTNMIAPYAKERPDQLAKWQEESMLGVMGSKQDLNGGVVYLASEASSFLTGQNLCIDGGTSSK